MAIEYIRYAEPVLDNPSSVPDKIDYGKKIYTSMHGKAYFTGLATELGTLQTDTNTLVATQNGFKSTPPTKTKAERDFDAKAVDGDLGSLRLEVFLLCKADPAHAEQIIEAAGMRVKHVKVRVPQTAGAHDGPVAHSVEITGNGKGAHNFRWSTDDETWTVYPCNGTSSHIEYDLIEGGVYYFQCQKILTKGRIGDWSTSFSIKVK